MIKVVEQFGSVIVKYIDDESGVSASATVVGLDKEVVEERAEAIVDTHNLRERASNPNQE